MFSPVQSAFETRMCVFVCVFSHVRLFAAPWAVACQAPLYMQFSRKEYCSRLPFPTPPRKLEATTSPVDLFTSIQPGTGQLNRGNVKATFTVYG